MASVYLPQDHMHVFLLSMWINLVSVLHKEGGERELLNTRQPSDVSKLIIFWSQAGQVLWQRHVSLQEGKVISKVSSENWIQRCSRE